MAGSFKVVDEAADDRMAAAPSVWAYAPRILAYPLHGHCVAVLIFGTPVVWMVVRAIQAFADQDRDQMIRWLEGIFAVGMGVSLLFSYLLRVIEHTAVGHATSPPVAASSLQNSWFWLARALLYPAGFLTAFNALVGQHPQFAWTLAALGVLLWPAHAMSLATEGSALAAINPLRLLQIVFATGPLYLLACVIIGLAAWGLRSYASNVYGALFCGLGLYVVLVVCHLLGFIANRRHHALDLAVEVGDPQQKQLRREQAERFGALLTRVESSLVRGDADGAAREILAEPGGPASVRQFHEDLFSKLLTRGNPLLIHTHGRRFISVLLNENRPARALEVYETCLSRHPAFEPETPLQLELLAREALAGKYDALLFKMLKNLDTRYPNDPIIVSAGLLQARCWCELRNDDAKALEVLQPLLAYEKHPQHRQVVALVRVLGKSGIS